MVTHAVSADAQHQQPPQGRTAFSWASVLNSVVLYGCIAFTMTYFLGMFGEVHNPPLPSVSSDTVPTDVVKPAGRYAPMAYPGAIFDVNIRASDDAFEPIVFSNLPFDSARLASASIKAERMLHLQACVVKNCTIDLTVVWSMLGVDFTTVVPLIRFFPVRVSKAGRRLFGEADQPSRDVDANSTDLSYRAFFQPNLTLSPVVDFTNPLSSQCEDFTPLMESRAQYGPALYVNNFWTLRSHMLEVNSTTTRRPFLLTVAIQPLPMWKVLLYTQYEKTMGQQQALGLAKPEDSDETKRIFLETNPYLLGLTALVTLLHMVFEYLAFSNDVRFWKGRDNFKGLSLRSVFINCYFQTITFLYLLDSDETSWSILMPSGLGVLLEYWKLTQTLSIARVEHTQDGEEDRNNPIEGDALTSSVPGSELRAGRQPGGLRLCGYTISFRSTYDKRTRKHDDTAVRYLIYAMAPLLLMYSVYSAVYGVHKGWYSFLIHTQVQFIYFFGFAMMTPQIFINYKMKSVGQLPWRTFIYKSLNTVIDDLFAFIITMPWLHRLACFRDDVVFLILLYQRWIYPVDNTRNADEDDVVEECESEPPATQQEIVSSPTKKRQ